MRPEGSKLTLVGSADAYHRSDDTDPYVDKSVDVGTTALFGQRFAHRFADIDDFSIRRGYTGVYDVTPDGQPILRAVPEIMGLYLACGSSGLGFKLSPVIGQMMAESICDGESCVVDLELFRASRFTENDMITSPYPYSQAITGSH
jgi:sarcosine oxidase, subunit beta